MSIIKKTIMVIFTICMLFVCEIAFCHPIQVSAKVKKPGKTKASSIELVSSDMKTNTFEFKWKKVKNVDGYQVRIIDSELYEYDDKTEVYVREKTKKNSIKIDVPERTHFKVQVRAFVDTADGERIYGKWVVSTKDFRSFILIP